jgi:hypothetical protein
MPSGKVPTPAPQPPRQTPQPHEANGKPNALPADGPDLERRLADYDAKLAGEGPIMPGDLVSHVSKALIRHGHGSNSLLFKESAIRLAAAEVRSFEADVRSKETRKQGTLKRISGKEG